MPTYRTGLLIIRAWLEKGSRKPLRAQIRATTDVSKGFDSELTVTDVATTSAAVETRLGDVMADGQVAKEGAPISKGEISMTTREFKDLKDLPVVANAEAREIGRVHEVLFDPAANALFGL